MKVKVIEGNLLESNAEIICHQCNCLTKKALGLAKAIFDKYPYADAYTTKQKRVVGTVLLCGDGKEQRYVANMYGQYYPGKRGYGKKKRLEWFRSCLYTLKEINGKSYAFPYGIGCGLAGGDWKEYKSAIDKFARDIKGEVYIIKLK